MTKRKYNFCAGPSMLPLEVLEQAQQEFVDYQDSGMSLLEMSHRGEHYDAVHEQTLALMREVYRVPDDFSILLIQGGATLQFGMVPLNLLPANKSAAYVMSGAWAKKAFADAKTVGSAYLAWDGEEDKFSTMPSSESLSLTDNTAYLHITSNETIGGIQLNDWPKVDVPVIVDMSSDILSRPLDWDLLDLVYAGSQKNLAPSGVSVVIIRDSLVEQCNQNLPAYLRYDQHKKNNSLLNTPPVFPIYMMGKVLNWIKDNGGIDAMFTNAKKRAGLLYDAIDQSEGFYDCPVAKADRSLMNVVFKLHDEALEKEFLSESQKHGMEQLKGHRSVGGFRASLYNAMPEAGVVALCEFMREFQKKHL